MMRRAYKVLEPEFIKHVLPESGHAILASQDQCEALLESLPDTAGQVRENLTKKWKKSVSTPAEKWAEVKKHLEIFTKKTKGGGKTAKTMTSLEQSKLETWPAETVFKYTYPRLDINVSKMQNHLLKSPFCVHPKTGRVCVPIQVENVDRFDPFAVPTLSQLMREINEYDGPDVPHEWMKTSLNSTFGPFQKEFLEPMWKELRRKQRDEAEERAAMNGDF